MASLLSCGSNEDDVDFKLKKQAIVSESENIISSNDPDFNGWEHFKLFKKIPTLNLYDSQEFGPVLTATLLSRSTLLTSQNRIIGQPMPYNGESCEEILNNQSSSSFSKGNGFLVGLNTMATSHHVALHDGLNDVYTFISPTDRSDSIYNSPSLSRYNVFFLERLYRLGFIHKYHGFPSNVTFFDLDPNRYDDTVAQFDRFEGRNYKDYYGNNPVGDPKKDLILEKFTGQCIDDFKVKIMPGILHDWTEIATRSNDPKNPNEGEYLYSSQYQLVRSVEDDGSLSSMNDSPIYPGDLLYDLNYIKYTMLPGVLEWRGNTTYVGTPTNDVGCGFSIDYKPDALTSMDGASGSSGGPIFMIRPLNNGRIILSSVAWGVAAAIYMDIKKDLHHAFGYDQNVTSTPTKYNTLYESFSDSALKDIRRANREPEDTSNPGTALLIQPDRYPEPPEGEDDPEGARAPNSEDIEGDCIGDCDNPVEDTYATDFNCTEYMTNRYRYLKARQYSSGIGVMGIPLQLRGIVDDQGEPMKIMGNFGILCSPWSSYPYTEFWHVVHAGMQSTYPAKWDQDLTHRNYSNRPFSEMYNQNSYTKRNADYEPIEQKTLPFQNCPPGYVLKDVKFILTSELLESLIAVSPLPNPNVPANTIAGVEAIRCTKIYTDSPGPSSLEIPLKPNFFSSYPENLRFETNIGSNVPVADFTLPSVWKGCPEGSHINGYRIASRNPDRPMYKLTFQCVSDPLPLPKNTDMCNVKIKSALSGQTDWTPSCVVGATSTWGNLGNCPN